MADNNNGGDKKVSIKDNTRALRNLLDIIRGESEGSGGANPVAKNTTTNKTYSSVQKGLSEALDTETVILLSNAEEANVSVPLGVTLDLNSYTLTVSGISSLGDVVDNSESNTGLLVPVGKILLAKNNAQLPVKDGNGYRFFEIIKINEAITGGNKFAFQPFIEPSSHSLIKSGTSGVLVYVKWTAIGISTSTYSETYIEMGSGRVNTFLDSYNSSTGKYGQMLTLTNKDIDDYLNSKCYVCLLSKETGVEILSTGVVVVE